MWKRRAVLELVVVWCVGFGGWMYPTPNVVISGGMGISLVLAGLGEAAGAERRPVGARITVVDAGTTCGAVVNGMVLCGSVRSAVCTDGVTESATADGNSHDGWHRPQRWS